MKLSFLAECGVVERDEERLSPVASTAAAKAELHAAGVQRGAKTRSGGGG